MSKNKGDQAELLAIEYLLNLDYTILAHNFYFKGGEIDIIVTKNDTLHFVEVKSGISFEPIYNITPSKIRRISKGAFIYMKKYKLDMAFCIDALIVKNKEIEFIKNITL
jgi:putative endonuclease